MRWKLLACPMIRTECETLILEESCPVEAEYLEPGLHERGAQAMRFRLAERLAASDTGAYDAILLGYGLCGNGIVGLSTQKTPLVVPRVHDCITLLFGGVKRFEAFFFAHPGTYFKTVGWLERPEESAYWEEMTQHYTWLTFLRTNPATDTVGSERSGQIAAQRGWELDVQDGDLTLLRQLLSGAWNDEDFLILSPGETIENAWDGRVIQKHR